MNKAIQVFSVSCLAVLCALPAMLIADDTEIYFSRSRAASTSSTSIMFMFDTSGSMDEFDDQSDMRINRLKKAIIDVVNGGPGVKMGIGSFNGEINGGSIRVPPVDVDEDRCPGAACDDITVRSPIKDSEDDATEQVSGTIALNDIQYRLGDQMVGLRFQDLNIPRGATINHAAIEFVNVNYTNSVTNLTVTAHDIGDAPVFSSTPFDISSRLTVPVTPVPWVPENWNEANIVYQTPDIGSVVQAVTNRSDWCGGNSLALILDGTGERNTFGRDNGRWETAVLKVNYDPATVDFSNTCISKRITAQVELSIDDVVENSGTGDVSSADDVLLTHNLTTSNIIGLRFRDIQVPNGAVVTNAQIHGVSGGFTAGAVNLDIRGELSGNSMAFNPVVTSNVSSRTKTLASVKWTGVEEYADEAIVTGIDIDTIINEIVNQPSWTSNNPLTLFLQADAASTGTRSLRSVDDREPVSLTINYQLDGSVMAGTVETLRLGREDLIDEMYKFRAKGATPLIDAYYEAAAFMTGKEVYYGKRRGAQWDVDRLHRLSSAETYTGGSLYRPPSCLDVNLSNVVCKDEVINGSPVYTAPIPGECQKNQIVLLSDGEATENDAQLIIPTLVSAASCATRVNPDENCGLELGKWLATTDHFTSIPDIQPIITHTVGFSFSSDFLSKLAEQGEGGFYTANSSAELAKVFTDIVENAAEIDSSFIAPTVSASQTNRLTNGDDLYFGMFRPASVAKWEGNLKKYQFGDSKINPGTTVVVDDEGNDTYDPTTGGIKAATRSIWSTANDGASVSSGGAASKLSLTRNLYTYLPDGLGGYTGLVDFAETNTSITKPVLGITSADDTYRTNLLKWARGVDILDSNGNGDITEVRAQMGDPLHSPPTIIDYAGKSLVFVGTNEGFLHAFDSSDGTEAFAFTPYELLGNLDTFYKNEPTIEHTYGLDGEITTWINDTNNNRKVDTGESAYVVVGMRRGGRNYYALNVSDPSNVTLAWVIRGGSGDFAELGQTWSKPIRTKVKIDGTEKKVLIFSAGYDPQGDDEKQRNFNDTMGRGIFIVDEANGQLIAKKTASDLNSMKYSIPSSVRVIDINLDGYADYMFVGDTGGQVWRFDIDNLATGNAELALTGGVIADFGGAQAEHNRHFFYEPDVSLLADESGVDYLSIAIGSGWRAHPLNAAILDRFYVFRDYSVFTAPPKNGANVIQYTTLYEADIFNASTVTGDTDTSGKIDKGWFMELTESGEKVLSRAVTVNEQVLFTTYLPDAGSVDACGISVGSGRAYAMDIRYGKPLSNLDESTDTTLDIDDRYVTLTTPGIPPSVSALIPESSPDSPVFLVGQEVLDGVDFGQLFKRTFWAEH